MDACPICLDDLDESSPALGCGHRCHASCLGQLAHQLGSTPTRRGVKISCPTCRRESRVAICAPPTAEFSVGDAVLGLWGHRWFPGVVDAVIDGGRAYEIAYDDGDRGEVTANHCRRRRDADASSDDEIIDLGPSLTDPLVPAAPLPRDIAEIRAEYQREARHEQAELRSESVRRRDAPLPAAPVAVATQRRRPRKIPYDPSKTLSPDQLARMQGSKATGRRRGLRPHVPTGRANEARAMVGDLAAIRRAYAEEQGDASESDGEETVVYVEWRAARYRGIQWDSGQHKWMARYKNPKTGERVIVGYYSDDIEAARAHDAAVCAAGLTGLTYTYDIRSRAGKNPFEGVYWNPEVKKYKVEYEVASGRVRPSGTYTDPMEAARAYNAIILREKLDSTHKLNAIVGGLPVPREDAIGRGVKRHVSKDGIVMNRQCHGILLPLPLPAPNFHPSEVVPPDPERIRSSRNGCSKYFGVTWEHNPPRWTAVFSTTGRMGGRAITIDYFKTEEEAAHAYNAAIRRHGLESIHKTNPVVNGVLVPRPTPRSVNRGYLDPRLSQPPSCRPRGATPAWAELRPGKPRPYQKTHARKRKAEQEWKEWAREDGGGI